MKVAHIGWLVSSHLKRRALALARKGVETVVFTDAVPDDFDPSEDFAVEVLPTSLRSDPQAMVRWLDQRLAAHAVDLLHIHSTHFPASLGFFTTAVPRVTSIWDFVFSRDPVSPLFHKVILEELFNGTLSEFVSFSSPVVRRDWEERGFPPERAFSHSWGVNRTVFNPERNEAGLEKWRQRLGFTPEEKVIFSPRTPSLQANLDLLLQALPRLAEASQVRCLITGHCLPRETRYLERFLENPAIRDRVLILDAVRNPEDLKQLYQLASVTVSLHSNDHNPATVLEAMACGSPVLIGESETVEHWIRDKDNGAVAGTRDLNGLVKTLDRILAMPRETLEAWNRVNARRIVVEADFTVTVDQVLGDYETVAQASPPVRRWEDSFYLGLLYDICGLPQQALAAYVQTAETGESGALAAKLAREQSARLEPERHVEAFHLERAEPVLLGLATLPIEEWPREVERLNWPRGLYLYGHIAGFYPLAAAGRTGDVLHLIRLLSRRFHTDEMPWLAGTMEWFGGKWGMQDFCADLLLSCGEGGSSLAVYALDIVRSLEPGDGRRERLLERILAWTEQPVDHIHPGLDRTYREEVRRQASALVTAKDATVVRGAPVGV